MTLNIQTDRRLVREAGQSTRFALLSFTAPDATRAASRPPLNVAFVVDRSGSMGGSKIALAREAVIQALRMLRDPDWFSIVAYDHEIDVLVPSTQASPEALRNASSRVNELQARGNTDLSGGWLKGCEQIAELPGAGRTTRCLLLSDGLANAGIVDREELAGHSRALGERGIKTSCLGIGNDYDERLLEAIATSSGGHSYDVETAVQIPDILTSELGEALEIVARDVVVTIRPGTGMAVTTLNKYPLLKNADGSLALQLGDLSARQDVSLVFRIEFPAGSAKATLAAAFRVSDAAGALTAPETDIVWTFAAQEANDAQPRNRTVDHAVAQLYAAAAKAEALEMNRNGRYDQSGKWLERTARKIEAYAGDDAFLRGLVAELREQNMAEYSAPMPAARMKRQYAANLNMSRMRDESGKARRRPN